MTSLTLKTCFVLEMAASIVAREETTENREKGRGFFPHVFIYFESQKNTLYEHIICQAMLFLISFRK